MIINLLKPMKYKNRLIFTFILCVCIFNLIPSYAADKIDNIEETARMPKFDSRDYGVVTAVRDQGYTSLCWAYSAVNASETSILRLKTDKNIDMKNLSLSPLQIGYARHTRGADPLGNTTGENTNTTDWRNAGGGTKYAAAMLSQWCGPVTSETPYNADGWENAAYKLKSAIAVDGKNTDADIEAREKMKKAIVKYGAVTFSYNNARETRYYNPKGENRVSPHACTIIGWDDTIPAEKFGPGKTVTDGGWLVKNSYASLPYFYLSYETTCEQIYAFEYVTNDTYDYNYFYDATAEDNGAGTLLKIKRAANVFEIKNENEYIKAVSVATVGENVSCTVEIYTGLKIVNGEIDWKNAVQVRTETGFFEYGGYNCIELNKPVKVEKGSLVAAAVTLKSDNGAYIALSQNEGNSYVYRGGWNKYAAPRIKLFTKKETNIMEFTDDTEIFVSASGGIKQFVLAEFEDEYLKNIYTLRIDFDKESEKTIYVPEEWNKTERTKYKAFLWDDFSDIVPVCGATTND